MRISEALTPVCNKFDRAAAEALLAKIPADLPYNDWFRVAAALKNSGADFSLFDRWSQTAPARYDATAAETLWNSLKANGKPGITFGTLHYIAEQYERSVQSAPVMFEMPGTTEEQALQIVEFIELLFHVGEHFEIVADTREDKNGRKIPDRSATQITNRDGMELHEQELQSLIGFAESVKSGAWISMNPVKSDVTDAPKDVDMAEFRNVLIEADSLSREEQWKQLVSLNLPIRAVTWSGGKSLHAIVKVDAGTDRELYNQRVAALYAYLAEKGFPVDAANKNPSRLTRLPGICRGADMQYLVARELGPVNWSVFEKMCLKQKKVKEDRRAETSPLNGLKGGRPSMPVTEYAERFLQLYSENGESRLHFWNNRCWHFIDGIWKEITNDELTIRITNFLQQQSVHHEGRIGTGLISDVITNLKGLCGLTNVNMPCWLPDGSDANDVACFSNGLLSIDKLTKGEVQTLQPVTPRYFGQNQVGYAYIPGADCPQWHQYLETTFDDEDSRAMLQMMFGYIISGKLDKNVGFFLVGRGGDGKSVAAHVLRKLVGENQTCCLPFANLGDKFSSYLLTEHRLNLVEELPVTAEIRNIADAEKIFKMVTDGAVIPVEQKFQSPQEKQASARCVFLANELPQFVDRSNGLWDRLIVLPFTHRFRDTDSEKANLKYDLEAELPGIFNWAIEGARRLAGCRRFPILQASREFLEKHRLACDHEASFLNEAVHPEDTGRCAKIVLYKCYRRWMEDHGYKPFGMDKFNAAVKVAFPNAREHRERVPNDRIIWTGIELNTTYYSEY